MLEDMKLGELLNLVNAVNGAKCGNSQLTHDGSRIRIVILQRGWVVVGKYYQRNQECWIEDGYVIRQWGTDKGLGQLATEGKQENTKLDKIPITNFHELTIVASMECNHAKWKELCK